MISTATAQQMFGNDIAYTITVDEMDRLSAAIHQEEADLVSWMAKHFVGYFGIKQWLEECKIGFRVEIESWA